MKFRSFLIGCLGLAVATGASAQVEYDDMYFNASDRSELNALRGTESLALAGKKKKSLTEEFNNPTDSYSARNINPEHISRSDAKVAREDEQDYFVTNYNQSTAYGYSRWNSQFNNWYNSPWYSTGWYGAYGASPWSPYYGHMYSPYAYGWGSPWYDPFYYQGYGGPAWSLGYGFSFGSFYRPWGWGLSSGYGWYNSWYPRTVVIVDNGTSGSGVQYGKRPMRGSATYNNSAVTNNRSRNSVATPPTYGRPNTGGRTASDVSTAPSTQQSSYYNKNWRNAAQSTPARSGSSWSSGSPSRSGGVDAGSYDRGSRSGTGYNPAPQRSYSGGSGYSGGSSGSSGGGSNGRTRGSR